MPSHAMPEGREHDMTARKTCRRCGATRKPSTKIIDRQTAYSCPCCGGFLGWVDQADVDAPKTWVEAWCDACDEAMEVQTVPGQLEAPCPLCDHGMVVKDRPGYYAGVKVRRL